MYAHISAKVLYFCPKIFSNLKFILYAWHILTWPKNESGFACGQCPPPYLVSLHYPAVTNPDRVL